MRPTGKPVDSLRGLDDLEFVCAMASSIVLNQRGYR